MINALGAAAANFIGTIVEVLKTFSTGVASSVTAFFDGMIMTAEGGLTNVGIAMITMVSIGFFGLIANFAIRALVRR